MNIELDPAKLELKTHQFGRVDKRMRIGPVQWPFHDLLWIHEGSVEVQFCGPDNGIELVAPAGVLILPGTGFAGHARRAFATASVCHFAYGGACDPAFLAPGYQVVTDAERLHVQNMVRLAMRLARASHGRNTSRRQRLLAAILDGFDFPYLCKSAATPDRGDRLAMAWELAGENLADMRTLSDVAGLIGINEGGFRALHRRTFKKPAGEYLRDLRLRRAEELLATTGFTQSQIAARIGYRHGATFSAAFKSSRGLSPGAYRRWSKPFA
jgi:AraC-like DNA-binding protein